MSGIDSGLGSINGEVNRQGSIHNEDKATNYFTDIVNDLISTVNSMASKLLNSFDFQSTYDYICDKVKLLTPGKIFSVVPSIGVIAFVLFLLLI